MRLKALRQKRLPPGFPLWATLASGKYPQAILPESSRVRMTLGSTVFRANRGESGRVSGADHAFVCPNKASMSARDVAMPDFFNPRASVVMMPSPVSAVREYWPDWG